MLVLLIIALPGLLLVAVAAMYLCFTPAPAPDTTGPGFEVVPLAGRQAVVELETQAVPKSVGVSEAR